VPRCHIAFLSLHPQWYADKLLCFSQQFGLSGSSATLLLLLFMALLLLLLFMALLLLLILHCICCN